MKKRKTLKVTKSIELYPLRLKEFEDFEEKDQSVGLMN